MLPTIQPAARKQINQSIKRDLKNHIRRKTISTGMQTRVGPE
jgi:hypothetical protein